MLVFFLNKFMMPTFGFRGTRGLFSPEHSKKQCKYIYYKSRIVLGDTKNFNKHMFLHQEQILLKFIGILKHNS